MNQNSSNTNPVNNQALAQPSSGGTAPAGSHHMTHQTNPSNPSDPYEKCAIQFGLPSAIIWQIKFIMSTVSNKKSQATASAEFATLAEGFGRDFDKYLLKELIDQIDIKDSSKAAKDKTTEQSAKITLLNSELSRACAKPEFLSYFSEIMQSTYGHESSKSKPAEFLQEITKRLKLNPQMQILVTLSMLESTEDDQLFDEIIKIFRQKLIELHSNGKPELLPEYAVHRILFLFDTIPELSQDPQLRSSKQLILESLANKFGQFTPLRAGLHQEISQVNCHPEQIPYNFLRDGGGLEHLEFVHKVLQPWEVLIDIGHAGSYMYDFLLKTLSEFKGIDEKVMAQTILQLAINVQGKDDSLSKIVYNAFEANKDGSSAPIKKEPEDKKTQMSWSIDNLARAFRELYSSLNWNKVFESFGDIDDADISPATLEHGLDAKQFQFLMALFNKSKPQNFVFPLQNLLSGNWKSASLQLTFIKNCISQYVMKKEKTIQFNKLKNKTPQIPDLQDIKERGAQQENIDVWTSVDLVEKLIMLSEAQGLYVKVLKVFEQPIKQLPEYLLLSISRAKPKMGNVMIDELLSILMPLFLGNHNNSSIVLQRLCDSNKYLFIRGICELCKHDQRLMNLSRVLDITQEVKDSLIPIVYCEDYNFAVNLGILAGKRDFLHYDVWIKSRIKEVGSPFINALIQYIEDHIISPVSDFVKRHPNQAESETFESQKNAILERSHLSKDKLILTIDNLSSPEVAGNAKVNPETRERIAELVAKNHELFPQHYEPGQNSEEIDAAANDHFQRVFSADEADVDERIAELIQTMQKFKESPEVKEQEIYACMLHGLFDEYRFLHRYPQQYLTKIAKLFGAIIKNKLLESVLQDIALKFVIEAFRRDGRRQKFGVIVIRSFFDMLPEVPKFLEDIYQIRSTIESSEPQMKADIERLYEEMLQSNQAPLGAARSDAGTELTQGSTDEHLNVAAQIADQLAADDGHQSDGNQSCILSVNSARMSVEHAMNKSDKGSLGNQQDLKQAVSGQSQKDNKKNSQNLRGNPPQATNQGGSGGKQNQKNQRAAANQSNQAQALQNTAGLQGQPQGQDQSQQQVLKSVTPPMANAAKGFIPTNTAGRNLSQNMTQLQLPQTNQLPQGTNQAQQISQTKVFFPVGSKQGQNATMPNATQPLADNMMNLGMQAQQNQFKQNQTKQQTGGQPQQTTSTQGLTVGAGGGTGLNIGSAEFRRPMSNSGMAGGTMLQDLQGKQQEGQINIESKAFIPSGHLAQEPFRPSAATRNEISQHQIQELLDHQKVIEEKMNKAKEAGTKARLDDLLEDDTIKVEDEYVEDRIRIICNNTGLANLKAKLEELKKFVIKKAPKIGEDGKEIIDEKSAKADDHLRWFIHYILTKRLGAQSVALQNIYVEMIRELNKATQEVNKSHSVVSLTLTQAALIFKKCMVIDEEEFMKVTNVAQGSAAVIKGYLSSLGSFVGSLTLAKNEAIRSTHLDLKQILIEGFQVKNVRLAVTFVCRIIKESHQSRVFTHRNPWIHTLLGILSEIYKYLFTKIGNTDHLMEIESLFRAMQVQPPAEFEPHGILQSITNPNAPIDQVIRKEVEHLYRKVKMILPPQPALSAGSQSLDDSKQLQRAPQLLNPSGAPRLGVYPSGPLGGVTASSTSQYSESEMLRQQMTQISQILTVSPDLIQIFKQYPNFNEQKVRRLVGSAVDNSIVEILPPVVDRSVTIALITTRELVLKDFAYDRDFQRVLDAADLIVQNLAGSLALVTCREPLRMSLTTNLKKIFDQHFKMELGIEISSNSIQGGQNDQNDGASTQNASQGNNNTGSDSLVGDQNKDGNYSTTISEEQINEMAVLASKENLELGCKLIKKEVIEKALKKVREDREISQAVERRKRADTNRPFRDETIVAQFQELPSQLQPNQNGLTQAQFQVYEDFSKLGQSTRDLEQPAGQASAANIVNDGGSAPPGASGQGQNPFLQQQSTQNLTNILKSIDQFGLTDINKGHLIHKINQMNQQQPTEEEREKLWTYVRRNLETACKNYDSRNPQGVEPIIQVLSLIVTSYKVENFSKKLLTKVFLQLDVRFLNEVELDILLMSKGIISISEWDSQLAIFFEDSATRLPENELQFFANFLETSIVEKKILTKDEVPKLISVIEKFSRDQKIGKFCQYILETLNYKGFLGQSSAEDTNNAKLREFFIKCVVMSYVDDKDNQEKQINTLYKDLRGMGIDSDSKLLCSFLKVMVQTSIEKALIFGDDSGEKRPADRLDFRYIDYFVKLIVIILKIFSFNKHEFMTKVLEFIGEVLDEDHRTRKAEFNQRPYYRMLMNILTAVNHTDCFNQKTQILILFSMADLFKKLNPSIYPAFCFSWLELISHKQFLPHFLRAQQVGQNTQPLGTGGMLDLGQQQFINIPSLQNANGLGQIGADNQFHERRFKIADLIVNVFTFLKSNMVAEQPVPPAIQAFYHATLRVVCVIKQDFPDFLSDFHFNFINSLPDHCIQLRNLILSAYPANIQQPDPFRKDLKIDLLSEIKQNPKILSNYENYLSLMNLREDLDNYTRTRNPRLITEICHKMEQSEEIVNGRRRINSNVISAVVLFIADQACQQQPGIEKHRESRDTFKQIVQRLNDETRLCFLNAIINELRFPNNHTFYFLCIILFIYAEAGREIIFEQISSIFLERLQTQGPYPWGLMISFRELIQNPKFAFMKKQYIREHSQSITRLFQGQLRNFIDFVPVNQRTQLLQGTTGANGSDLGGSAPTAASSNR